MEDTDDALLAEFVRLAGGYMSRARMAGRAGHADSVQRILGRVEVARQRSGYDDVTPDAVYLESRIRLSVGDTLRAAAALDQLFDRLPTLTPGLLGKPLPMAGLIRAMQLRAMISSPSVPASPWGAVADVLWASRIP
jgi:hypothetical protein